jgi:arylsulfatase A-like enzyme
MISGEGGEEPAPPAYFETLHAGAAAGRHRGLIAGGWKLIRSEDGSFVRLYDVVRDPEERVDLSGREPARVEAMAGALDALVERLGEGAEEERIPVDRGTREILKSLGYVW